MLHVTGIPAFHDNYVWLLQRPGEPRVTVVDPGDAAPVLAFLQQQQLQLDSILVTHHHRDHIGGVPTLKAATGATVYGPAIERIAECDVALHGGETIRLAALQLALQVLAVPGHVREHIAYYGEGRLFCGDTLFMAGCGRVFTGTVEQLFGSLNLLKKLPAETLIYCTHEYTASNLRFARAVEPTEPRLSAREADVLARRSRGESTVPGTLAVELQSNPFLRCEEPALQQAVAAGTGEAVGADALACFTALRAWKNRFS